MQNLSHRSAEDATIAVLSANPPGPVKVMIKAQLIRGTRQQIAIKAKAEKNTAWTPELVLRRMHKDSEPKVFLCYELAGIDEADLLKIARQALESIGIKCPSSLEAMPTLVALGQLSQLDPETLKAAPEARKSGLLALLWGWIKNIFWSVKK